MSDSQNKKAMGAAHTGFHDWYWQRVSAVVLLLGMPIMMYVLFAAYNGNIHFNTLNHWLTHPIIKSLSVLFLLALSTHIWTGLKVMIEDYIHTSFARVIVLNALLLGLVGYVLYMIYHIWAELSYVWACTHCGAR
jgi:succinate dehydrogenase / fumarate reductase membrane anchor subunit